MSRRATTSLVVILILLLGLRLALIPRSAADPLGGDEVVYDNVALNVATGVGYIIDCFGDAAPTASRGPTYILLVAAIYRAFGHHLAAPFVVQAFLEAISCLLLFAISHMLFRRSDIALVAAFLYAVYPPFVIHTGLLLTEVLTNLTVLFAAYGFLRYRLFGGRSKLYVAAVATAIGALSKPILFVFPALFAIADYVRTRRRQVALDLVVQVVVIGLVSSPWFIRNALVFEKFIPGVTQGGFTFWGATGPADGRVIGGLVDPHTPEYVFAALEGKSEVQREQWFYRDGLRIVRENPSRYGLLMLKKIPRLWFNLLHDDPPSKASIVLALFNAAMMTLALIGLRRCAPPRESSRLLVILVAYFTAVHMIFFSVVRYSFPVYAYMFAFSAAGIVAIAERLGWVDKSSAVARAPIPRAG